jgi:hypothetical protein
MSKGRHLEFARLIRAASDNGQARSLVQPSRDPGHGAGRHRLHPHRPVGPLERAWGAVYPGLRCESQLVALAHGPAPSARQRLERMPKYKILTEPQAKGVRYKEQILVEKEFYNQKLVGEAVAEMEYQPGKCGFPYRVAEALFGFHDSRFHFLRRPGESPGSFPAMPRLDRRNTYLSVSGRCAGI